jgi:hypothetical protein
MKHLSKPNIPNTKGNKQKKIKVDLSYYLYRVMKEMGWTIEELKNCPIPTFFLIIKWIQKEDEANEWK